MILTGIAASLIFFTCGLMTVVLDLVLTSRDQHGITVSPTSYVGLGLITFSIFSIALMSRRKLWLLPAERPQQQQTPPHIAAPILDLVASLIAEFAEGKRVERELKMQAAAQAMNQAEMQSQAQAQHLQRQAQAMAAASVAASSAMTPETPAVASSTETLKDPNRSSFN